jgi:hypothetical protein
MAGGLALPDGKAFAMSGGWGTFEGGHALGFGAMGRVSNLTCRRGQKGEQVTK